MNKAIFFDRDGTINVDYGYVFQKEKLKFLPTVIEALLLAKRKGYILIIVSNQSAIARKYCKTEDVDQFNAEMNAQLSLYGVQFDGIYICPHGEDDRCECRKPHVGLFLQAAQDFDVDFSMSYCVGDRVRDVVNMVQYGCKCALVNTVDQDFPCFKTLLEFVEDYVK